MAYSLPGTNGSPTARPVVALLVVATALFGCIAGALFLAGNRSAPQPPSITLSPSSVPSSPEPRLPNDLTLHLNNVKAHTESAIEQVNRTQQILTGLTPELGRNLLWTEQRRAEAAIVTCETAKQAASQALAELRHALSQKE